MSLDLDEIRERANQLNRIHYLSDLANRANVNAGFMAGMPKPIPAICTNAKCRFHWTGRDAIRSPSLENVRCFWCQSTIEPIAVPAGTQLELISAPPARDGSKEGA